MKVEISGRAAQYLGSLLVLASGIENFPMGKSHARPRDKILNVRRTPSYHFRLRMCTPMETKPMLS
jgi:hypothetical protein